MLGNGDGTFRGIPLGITPAFPTAAVLGDFEQKGALDVATLSDQQLYILSNNGDGALSLINTYALQQPGQAIVTADFNGDGHLDLMVASTSTDNGWGYTVLLGNGDGSFQGPIFYPQGVASPEVFSVVVADFNNDKKLDIAITSSSNSLALLLGNGDGTFAAPSYVFDGGGTSLVSADFNGDGKPDIAAGLVDPTEETGILLGNGDGTFQAAVFPANLDGFVAQFTADLNNDGKPDLLSNDQVALGNGDGTFTVLPVLTVGSYYSNFVSAIADFNGDGKLDLLLQAGLDHPEETGILLGNGDGTFGSLINVTTSGVIPLSPVLAADMNGDGQPDIVFPWENVGDDCAVPCAPSTTGVGVLLNTTQAITPQPDFQVFASGLSPTPVAAGNLASSTITLAPLHGFSGSVALSCTGLSTGVSCSFNPASIPGGSGTSTLTVTTTSGLTPSNYTVIVSGISGSISHIAALTLTVDSGTIPDFQISAAVPATVAPGSSTTSTVTITGLSGFNSAVALTCSSGSGITCSLNPASVTPSGSTSPTSTLTINTTTSVAVGTYSVTVYGTSGTDVHSIDLTITVQTPPAFTLGAASGSPTSQTINAGQTASFTVAIASTGSFTGTVDFGCAITPPVTPAPTCSLSSSSVQISGGGTQSVTVKVGTTAPVTSRTVPPISFPTGPLPLIWTLTLLGSGWLLMRNRKRLPALAVPIVLLAFVFSVGCGGSSSSSTHTTPGTPTGNYTVTITATSGSVTQNMALTMVVQ